MFKSYYISNKGGIFTIYERILSEQAKLNQKINSIKNQLATLPEGNFICSQNGNRYKWYQSDGHKKTYIPKKNRKLAEELAMKRYLSLLLEDLEKEKLAIEFYLRHYSLSSKAEQLLNNSSEYQKLLSPYFKPMSQELTEWMNELYERNTICPEHLVHKSISGNILRSKSEAMIDMLLYMHHIPFRYECALSLGKTSIFPDFTIRHPKTSEFYYWEHFGMMDDMNYSGKAYSKLHLYNSHGIIPSIQLITTYETKEHPLTVEVIEKIIEHYFL